MTLTQLGVLFLDKRQPPKQIDQVWVPPAVTPVQKKEGWLMIEHFCTAVKRPMAQMLSFSFRFSRLTSRIFAPVSVAHFRSWPFLPSRPYDR
jgi:hypothetical protein